MKQFVKHVLLILIALAIVATIAYFIQRPERDATRCAAGELRPLPGQQKEVYTTKQFNFATVEGLSQKQLSQHHTLYDRYVNKHNEIEASLATVDKTKQNTSYSVYRGLKLSETFTLNGVLLHELYFDNIVNGANTSMGPKTTELLTRQFGSIEAFKTDVMACCQCARGWCYTGYCLFDKTVRNFLLDAHNETVPLLTLPLLIIDTYEHAYMIDYGINRDDYLKTIWKNINWDVVERRVQQWVLDF